MRALINMDRIFEHRQRALSPDHPVLRGTAQNPDVFFQMRERANSYYEACPEIVQIGDEQVRRGGGTLLSPVRLRGRAGCRTRDRDDGLGRRSRSRNRRASQRAGRKAWTAESPHLYRPFPVQAFLAGPARQRAEDCCPRSHQGIGSDWRTALSRCRERASRRSESGLQPAARLRPRSWVDATGFPPRNSRRQWSRRSTTI